MGYELEDFEVGDMILYDYVESSNNIGIITKKGYTFFNTPKIWINNRYGFTDIFSSIRLDKIKNVKFLKEVKQK